MKTLLVLAIAFFASLASAEYVYTGTAKHDEIVYGVSWTENVPHSDTGIVNCARSDSGYFSQCYIALSQGLHLPQNATFVDLRVKLKIWANKSMEGYCLAYLYGLSTNLHADNHFEHAEMWFGTDERRVIDYTTLRAKVVDGKVVIGVGKQIENCSIDFAIYLEGYDI